MRSLLTGLTRIIGVRTVVLIAVALAALAVSPTAWAQTTCVPTEFELAVTLRLVGSAQVGSEVKVVAQNPRLVRERRNCTADSRAVPAFDWALVGRPLGSQVVLVKNGAEASLRLDRPGRFTVRFLACPDTCTFGSGPGRIVVQPRWKDLTIQPGSTDLWVMGLEIDQGVHDEVFRTIGTTPLVIARNSSRRQLVTGKPAVVRVYVGVRNHPNYPAQSTLATGTLRVTIAGQSQFFHPVSGSANCRLRIGGLASVRTDPCLSRIEVRPSLGRAGLLPGTTTPTLNDLDFVARRTRWSGTLNYIIPADVLADPRRVVLRAEVTPIELAERVSPDNRMVLDHRRIARGPRGIVRPVLVTYRDPATGTVTPSPSGAAASNALRQILRLTPLARLDTDGTWRGITYTGTTGTSQCKALWQRLRSRFGLHRERPLLAFVSDQAPLPCGGLGGRVESSWPFTKGGGIAWAKISSSTTSTDIDDYDQVAHELYHALGERHISNDHGEAGGCASTRSMLGLAASDPCWGPGDGPHGTIGVYPKRTVFGPLQSYDGAKGAMGVDLLNLATGPQLTLYDPCPTAVLTADPQASALMRFRATCPVPDENRAHDFMSYGDNRWASARQFFHRIELPLMPPP